MNPLEFSDTRTEIAKAMLLAQSKVGPLIKKESNAFFGSKYADLASVIETISPALQEAGIVMIQGASTEGATAHVETMLIHAESGQWVRSVLSLTPAKTDPQAIGSAITYARRYGLQAICGIAPEDDDGNAASTQKQNVFARVDQGIPPTLAAPMAARDYKLNPVREQFNQALAKETGQPVGVELAKLGADTFNLNPSAQGNGDTYVEGVFSEVASSEDGKCWFVKVGKINMWTRDEKLAKQIANCHGQEVRAHGRMKPGGKSYQIISYESK